jgi:hypothetical protein
MKTGDGTTISVQFGDTLALERSLYLGLYSVVPQMLRDRLKAHPPAIRGQVSWRRIPAANVFKSCLRWMSLALSINGDSVVTCPRAPAVRELLRRGLTAEGFGLSVGKTKSAEFGVIVDIKIGLKLRLRSRKT